MNKTSKAVTGAWIESSDRCTFYGVMNEPQPLQLDYTPEGDRCVYCNADAYTCEHYEEANQE